MKNGDAIKSKRFSLEAYLAYEETAEVRHEFREGQLIPMPGTTDTHNLLCQRITFALWQILKGTSCKVFMENVKVQITNKKRYTYPDVFVTCDERDLADAYIKRFPSVIVEVASPSTKVYDKTDKFLDYRKIPSLRHYLIVDSENEIVECYSTENGKEWMAETYVTKQASVPLKAINANLSLADIYE